MLKLEKNAIIIFIKIVAISTLVVSCNTVHNKTDAATERVLPKPERPIAIEHGKFFNHLGKRMLYGGEDSSFHFDISNCELNERQFHYGIGREAFPALLNPEFISISEADSLWADSARFLLAKSQEEVKAYAVKDLIHHEVVNDELNGKPIMAAYCILADLGAIYSREYGDQTLTFGLSGYTYFDDLVWGGLDGFVLWDRETESLWWPLIGSSVSGPLKGVPLQEIDTVFWEDTTWGNVKTNYPHAKVLRSGQDFERPVSWTKLIDVSQIKGLFE